MDKTSVIGLIIGFVAIGVGMVLKGVAISSLFNPAALLIIFAGTAAAIMIAFPLNEVKKLPKLFKILFTDQKMVSMGELIAIFIEWATIARKEGLLALEPKSEEIDDPFLKQGIKMIVDGQSPEFIKDVLIKDLETMEERHLSNAGIFSQAGTYAPTLGVLGAVVGLVAALGHMDDIEALGHAISAAFIATLFGIFTGYVLWHPFANKLKRKSQNEVMLKEIMIEGLLSIQDGTSPKILEEKLLTYIPASERESLKEGVSIG
ncbi:flagellar motor stator protein MotA [Fictibacillus sp. WQ 8-8]|uniref:flagellar motor stator protein MotA n=1 Tax=unclassified Fictibacillus TaxID=2644029 RepID=UPI00078091CB|nr:MULTISPECIES: flagellar motor stator protein MotA [unclassified Fictibacillus]MCQ6266969.1 flagellar motor stator protein MotA [Fictibacillus sp. WQ 8-8]SFE19629.1 chemotaxis protein MotA [Bacillus sp. OV194]